MAKSKKSTKNSKSLPKDEVPIKVKVSYEPKYCEQVIEYFNIEPYTEIKNSDGLVVGRNVNRLPLFGKFATTIGIMPSILQSWKKSHPEFAEACEMAKAYQKDILLTNGLLSLYHASVTIFAMKNILGWRDKIEATHAGGVYIHDLVNTVSKHNQEKDFIKQRNDLELVA